MKESQLSRSFIAHFGKYFRIEAEVNPHQSTRRIDLLLRHTNPNYVFGVELKSDEHKRGNDIISWLEQAGDYANSLFVINGQPRKIPVLIYPALSNLFFQFDHETAPIKNGRYYYYKPFHSLEHDHSNVNAFASMVGVGEIRKIGLSEDWQQNKYRFMYRNKPLWFESGNKVHQKNYESYFKTIEQCQD
jgi:hypothetical protein